MKGILFKPDMIQAIVEGRKTQTRRLDGLKEINKESVAWCLPINYIYQTKSWEFYKDINKSFHVKPRYQIGETVYIKEAWVTEGRFDHLKPKDLPNDALIWFPLGADFMNIPEWVGRLRSPLHLPERFARYFIKILDVRAERLQEITGEGACKEGIELPFRVFGDGDSEYFEGIGEAYIDHFKELWDSINGKKYPWESNPWDFAYTFRRENV